MPNRFGWILVHSKKVYGKGEDFDFESPQDELRAWEKRAGKEELRWNWKLSKPVNKGKDFTLLFSWHDEIFAESHAEVTHEVDGDESLDYNFAFILTDFKWAKRPVMFADMRIRPYHSLAVLTPKLLDTYHRLAGIRKMSNARETPKGKSWPITGSRGITQDRLL